MVRCLPPTSPRGQWTGGGVLGEGGQESPTVMSSGLGCVVGGGGWRGEEGVVWE